MTNRPVATPDVILVGAFHEVIELLEIAGRRIVGIIGPVRDTGYGYPFLGDDQDAPKIRAKYPNVPLIISPDQPSRRAELAEHYRGFGFDFCSVTHPAAVVSRSSRLGSGVIVQAGAHVSAQVVLGDFVKINAFANVMHDSAIGEFTTIAPNAVILGRVSIGRASYVGANATILPECKLGDRVVVGAGAVVTRDVSAGETVVGIPARERSAVRGSGS